MVNCLCKLSKMSYTCIFWNWNEWTMHCALKKKKKMLPKRRTLDDLVELWLVRRMRTDCKYCDCPEHNVILTISPNLKQILLLNRKPIQRFKDMVLCSATGLLNMGIYNWQEIVRGDTHQDSEHRWLLWSIWRWKVCNVGRIGPVLYRGPRGSEGEKWRNHTAEISILLGRSYNRKVGLSSLKCLLEPWVSM